MPDKLEGEAAKVGGSLKEQLTKKLGPLPVWAWIGIGVGALFMLGFFKAKGSGTVAGPLDSNAVGAGGAGGGNPFGDPFGSSTGGAATAPDPISGDPGVAAAPPATVQPLPDYVAPSTAGDVNPNDNASDPLSGAVTPIVEIFKPVEPTPAQFDPNIPLVQHPWPTATAPDTSTVPTDSGTLVGPDLGHQSPDAVDRNAAYNAVPIVIPYTQSPDAIDRNKQYADAGAWVSPIYTGSAIISPDAVDRNAAYSVTPPAPTAYFDPTIPLVQHQSPDAIDRNLAQAPSTYTSPYTAITPAQQPQPTYGAPAGTAY